MKLLEALQIANAPQQGRRFRAVLACGFTPLHLATALKAHLRRALPDRTVEVETGLYGDLPGTLERSAEGADMVLIALEWPDVDPRLGWRSMGSVDEGVLADAPARLGRIGAALAALARPATSVLALPGLPLPPVFHTRRSELHPLEAHLRKLIFSMAAAAPAVVLQPDWLPQPRHDLRSDLTAGFPYLFGYADALAAAAVGAALFPAPKKDS